jgi:hypothetical protein
MEYAYAVTPDWMELSQCFRILRLELALVGWNSTWLDGTSFTLSHLIGQFSQCFAFTWLDGIGLALSHLIGCTVVLAMFAYGGWNWRLVGWNWRLGSKFFSSREACNIFVFIMLEYLVGKNWNYPKDWCCTWRPLRAGPRF